MLFCFGLFALLLYYTVVANAECSYTYWNSSQHIEAHSSDFEKRGFQRCEFLIQASGPHGVELNFTRITGFGSSSMHEDSTEEEEEAEGGEEEGGGGEGQWTDKRHGRRRGGKGVDSRGGREGGGGGGRAGETDNGVGSQSHRQSVDITTTTTQRAASKLSSILSSPTPPTVVSSTVFTVSETLVEVPTTSSSLSDGKAHPGARPRPTTQPSDSRQGRRPCLPMVEIREVLGEGHEERRDVICRQRHNYQTPVVFHYASSVRIVYEWEEKQNSGFTLYFDFSKEKCVLKCDGHQCLRDSKLLCDGRYDCKDKTDELQPSCNGQLQPPAAATGQLDSGSLVKIIVIPTCLVVLIVLSVVCLLGRHHCQALSRTMHHRSNSHAGHLTCPPSHSSEGLTPSAGSTQECSEQAVALLPSFSSHDVVSRPASHHKTWSAGQQHSPPPPPHPHPPPRDAEIGLPPNIPVSPDGEEGYVASQVRLLHPHYCMVQSELFKAPPNKTVFDRESPPPYSLSPSQKSFGCSSAPPITSSSGFSGEGFGVPPGHVRVVRDSEGQPVVSRCYTMFTQSSRASPGGGGSGGGSGSRGRGGGAGAGGYVARDLGSSPRHRDQDRYRQQQQQCHQQRQQPRPRPPPPLSPPSRGAYSVVNNALRPTPIPAQTPTPTHTPAHTPNPHPSPLFVGSSVSGVQTCDTHHQNLPAGQSFPSSRAVSRDTVLSNGGGDGGGGDSSQGNSCDNRGSPPDYDLAFSDGGGGVGGGGGVPGLGSGVQQGSVGGRGGV